MLFPTFTSYRATQDKVGIDSISKLQNAAINSYQ
jgi:hypothetical protein